MPNRKDALWVVSDSGTPRYLFDSRRDARAIVAKLLSNGRAKGQFTVHRVVAGPVLRTKRVSE